MMSDVADDDFEDVERNVAVADDFRKRSLFIELYGAKNIEFLIDPASDEFYVTCQTHGIWFRCESLTTSHFNFVGEKDHYEIRCSIPSYETTKKRHVVRFENAAGKPFAAVFIEQASRLNECVRE